MDGRTPLRLGAAAAIVAIALVGLWQAGVLFAPANETSVTPAGENISVSPADPTLPTPNARDLPVGLKAGELAPNFEFSTYEGERKRLSDYRGRPVFLNFWATWCGPCRAEMPNMQTILEEFADHDLAVIAVNNGETLRPAQRFLDGISVELTAFAYDPGQAIVQLYQVLGMPTSYFIDREGVITRLHIGLATPSIMRSAVTEALAGADALGQ